MTAKQNGLVEDFSVNVGDGDYTLPRRVYHNPGHGEAGCCGERAKYDRAREKAFWKLGGHV